MSKKYEDQLNVCVSGTENTQHIHYLKIIKKSYEKNSYDFNVSLISPSDPYCLLAKMMFLQRAAAYENRSLNPYVTDSAGYHRFENYLKCKNVFTYYQENVIGITDLQSIGNQKYLVPLSYFSQISGEEVLEWMKVAAPSSASQVDHDQKIFYAKENYLHNGAGLFSSDNMSTFCHVVACSMKMTLWELAQQVTPFFEAYNKAHTSSLNHYKKILSLPKSNHELLTSYFVAVCYLSKYLIT